MSRENTLDDPNDAGREVYFEFTVIGSTVRVGAIDAATGIEVIVIGPAGAAKADLQRLALGKLRGRLARAARSRWRILPCGPGLRCHAAVADTQDIEQNKLAHPNAWRAPTRCAIARSRFAAAVVVPGITERSRAGSEVTDTVISYRLMGCAAGGQRGGLDRPARPRRGAP